MNLRTVLPLACVLLAGPLRADQTINFDDLGNFGGGAFVPSNYQGFNWNFFFFVTAAAQGGGFLAGMHSSPNVGYDPAGTSTISSSTPFNFKSGYLTSGGGGPTTIEARGFVNNVLTFDQTVNVSNTSATLVNFNFTGITSLSFVTPNLGVFDDLVFSFGPAVSTFAATPGLTPSQSSIASNIDFNSAAPSPALTAIIAGLGAVSGTSLPGAINQLSPVQFGQFSSATAANNATFATEQRDRYLAGRRDAAGNFLGGNGSIDASHLTVNDPSYDPGLAMVHSRMLAWNPAPFGTINDSVGSVLGGIDMKDMKRCTCAPEGNPWNVFVEGNVVLAQGFSQQDVAHFDANTASVTIGADYRISRNFLVGVTAGYGHTDATLDPNGSSATVDSYSPGLYASYADKGWYANFTGSYLHNAYTQSRVISFLGQTANSAPEGNEGVVSLDGGYDFHHGALTYGPLIGIQYTHLTVDGYTEGGSDAALTVNEQQSDSLRSRLGGRVSYDFKHCGLTFTPHLDASWVHEFMDQSRGITSQFNSGLGSFSVQTLNPSRDSALVDAGLSVQVDETITAFGDYVVQAGQENYFAQSVEAGVKIGF